MPCPGATVVKPQPHVCACVVGFRTCLLRASAAATSLCPLWLCVCASLLGDITGGTGKVRCTLQIVVCSADSVVMCIRPLEPQCCLLNLFLCFRSILAECLKSYCLKATVTSFWGNWRNTAWYICFERLNIVKSLIRDVIVVNLHQLFTW